MKTKLSGTYDDMIVNFESIMSQLDERINEVGQLERDTNMGTNTKMTGYLNKLKLERAKVKQIIYDMGLMEEGQVLDLKEEYSKDYRSAIEILEASFK